MPMPNMIAPYCGRTMESIPAPLATTDGLPGSGAGEGAIVADMRTVSCRSALRSPRRRAGHPERPERIRAIRDLMTQYRRDGLVVEPRRDHAELALNHDPTTSRVASTASRARAAFDADTQVCSGRMRRRRRSRRASPPPRDDARRRRRQRRLRAPARAPRRGRPRGLPFNNVAIGAHWFRTRGIGRI
jgi:acetoin utilization deacetylase AcuC-like enzyme